MRQAVSTDAKFRFHAGEGFGGMALRCALVVAALDNGEFVFFCTFAALPSGTFFQTPVSEERKC